MKVLGVDPGTRVVGYGIVENQGSRLIAIEYGAICVDTKEPLSVRLHQIYGKLTEVIHQFQPDVMAIEKVFYGKNIQSAIKIGEGRGVALLSAADAGLDVYEYDATKIKKSVVGTGSAHKTQIQAMVKAILNLEAIPDPADAADALGIAICHHHSSKR